MIMPMRCAGTTFASKRNGMLTILFRLAFLMGISLFLSACAPIMMFVGYGQSAVQFAAQVDRVKLIADGVSFVGSGKTLSDHALSLAKGEDCKMMNVVSRDPVCSPVTANTLAAP